MSREPANHKAGQYHILVDKSIKNGIDLTNLIICIVTGFMRWHETRYIRAMKAFGHNGQQIANSTGQTRSNISMLLAKSAPTLVIVDSENRLAPPDRRGTASLSSLSTGQLNKEDTNNSLEQNEFGVFNKSAQSSNRKN